MADESKKPKKKRSAGEYAMWILMGLLIVGLGVGFGFDNGLAGGASRVAKVGDKEVTVNAYARRLQNELQRIGQQTGQAIPFSEVIASGLDRNVLEQLMRERALDHEASEMGISIGDGNLSQQIRQIPAFQGVDGSFDREGYTFALENAGLNEGQFETQLREETSRNILQAAVLSGLVMPDTYAETIVNFAAETRNITWVRFDQETLDPNLPEADETTLRAFYNDNIDRFQLPESKRLTFAVLQPEDLADTIDVPAEDLQQAYDSRSAEFNAPERRLVERLVFLDEAAADAAAAQLEVGTSFEALVEERGLTLQDVDMGDMGRLELDAAGEAVFTAEVGDVVGPLPSNLGPALYRVNGVLPAQNRTLEDVEDLLRQSLIADRARRQVEVLAEEYNDLLAGGATLEELADETDMQLGTVDWHRDYGEGIAAYVDFAQAAAAVTEEDFPEILRLDDGSIFALRLDEILPERPTPYDVAKEEVTGVWETERAERLLREEAEALLPQVQPETDLSTLGVTPRVEENVDRSAVLTGTPTDFVAEIFEMEPGETRILTGFGAAHLVRLDGINPGFSDPRAAALRRDLSQRVDAALAQDIFGVFAADAMLRAGRQIEPHVLDAVNANFQ